ncbi:SCP2 sterol-binding domain-containing protein [Halocatena marina]|uniref:SCP2 sterol-binding domain-containing protein n=1 Tax=Halocatena marina TaxID=2934937 RepID=A0ABD5YK72_9EURY|nr:SCP2 sterol-binding domain-containing protein [Halocatena marina]
MAIDIVNEREAWINEWMNKVNTESDYHETGQGWGEGFNGDFVFEVEVDDEYQEAKQYTDDDIENGIAFFAEVSDGEVHDATPIDVDDIAEYDYGFNYHGTYSNWKELIKQNIGPIDGLMSGQFEIEGDMQKILQWSDGASSLANASGMVETSFPEEEA